MKLYDMISIDDYEIESELPENIYDKLTNPILNRLKKLNVENKIFLKEVWKISTEVCQEYINNKWIEYLGINTNDLLNDIRVHSILTIYLSIKNKDIEGKSLEEVADLYYDYNEEKKYPGYFSSKFKDTFEEFTNNAISNDSFIGSDLYNCFLYKNKGKEDYKVYMDYKIFYEVIKNWDKCPFNRKNEFGMDFHELKVFYSVFEDYLKENDDIFMYEKYNNNEVSKEEYNGSETIVRISKMFYIERFFNVSFLDRLTKFINSKYDNDIKNGEEESIARQKQAKRLLLLSEIASIPMIFSRNKYIDIFNAQYINTKVDFCISYDKFLNSLYYLNLYLIPLMTRVYYYLLFTYTVITQNKSHNFIYNTLTNYINNNFEEYNYEEIASNVLDKFKDDEYSKALQINVTNKIYNFQYSRENIDLNFDIFDTMKNMDSEMSLPSQVQNLWLKVNKYVIDFPINNEYLMYLKSKIKKE
ncbi:hypothetical protein [Clostridium guangxiense]|uniref:hypothetical protein n=1 Tax=Clostridium guangxiense TaxID=1662055 RepID=UPI001E64AA91|nr:hypothetical protein [Clostridium guangxiense]MCD2346861.1 hypothetical protein [Clostridium guangxiense]